MNIATRAQAYLNGWVLEKPSPKWLERFLTHQLPLAVTLLLVLLISWRAADFTWRMIPAPETLLQVSPSTPAAAIIDKRDPADSNRLAEVAKLHLFGVAGAVQPVKKVDKKAPETRLNLTLHGVFVGEESEKGAAIIGTSGSVQKYYKVGNAVMSGVTLQAVFEDRVVLLRNGQSEVLRFPKVSNTASRTAPRPKARAKSDFGPGPRVSSTGGRDLSQYRDMLSKEPLKIFEHIRFVPVRSREGMKGYRILPQKNRELYNQLGVRPSDLVTAVNGIPLANEREAVKLIEQLKEAQSLQVDIVRNGQPQSLTFDLN
ncbi:MAG: type II secretion system protein GspC [Candidatus Thiodiazotropha sp. (ex Dulcina madagascariensis)]|nr:type II secretion system protein GspC [Candidatus Thiodiazotropha sp. (ex Dulcina madagascariensis)]MCU7926810.1 type II secretion system protein GspC [Candidatus Thiodiazotropha sp. (ex Dulcina madagascariensis)]